MKKNILLIATGGTIACKRTEDGLAPVLNSDELLGFVPSVKDMCQVSTYSLMNKDSTEIFPSDWIEISNCIKENYDKYDGFVVCHGTDTMAYTCAALSYLIQNSAKPIIVTGSQQPIDLEINDARRNLIDSFAYACYHKANGVQIVFDGEVIIGTRAKKTHSKSYNAFSSINYPIIASIKDGKIAQYIYQKIEGNPIFYTILNPKVALMKLIPGSSFEILDFLLKTNDAVVIESFGAGGVPSTFYDSIKKGAAQGKIIVMTTQVANEGSDMTVYKVGKSIKEQNGLLEAFDMTIEVVTTKLMWALGVSNNIDTVKELFYTKINRDILLNE